MDGTGRIAIGRLSKHTGTNIETIRYYERVGLLPAPARSPGGYRLYETDHLKRLNFIRRARTLGFSIGEVRTLLRLADERKRPCAEVRVVAEAHSQRCARQDRKPQEDGAGTAGDGGEVRAGQALRLRSDRGALSKRLGGRLNDGQGALQGRLTLPYVVR